ncbi:Alcohol dehydrogenase [Acidisarcina polymorpha]|uniref:Alcohol dehydrogenase n=1 Tax=Acidisarcina polymorpha TaxID=2211140 RepID=A0A2Z5FVQ7_9BACT|nr:NAD(P)-dependent alcohol dehydrogenase [Acidisarcina polymorpha]AXC10496.1 Alcohol dehydrogenase [Acidisarcina polymorpha]
MKSWRISSFGIDNLEVFDSPIPKAGPGQVVVRVKAVSLNYRDLRMVTGLYDPRLAMPRIPCSDGSGEIVEVGEAVSDVKPGDRVAGIFMQRWLDGPPSAAKQLAALGGDVDGMLAEFVLLDASGVVGIPPQLSYEEAATLPCAGVTAWNAVVTKGSIKPGDTVVIQGTGGVSIFALQFAKLLGARVLGTSSSDEKLVRAKMLGLDAGVNYKTQADWADWIRRQTNGEGADLVVEVGGSGTFAQSLKALRIGGMVAQIGVLSQSSEPLQIAPILHKQVQVHGIYVGSKAHFLAMNRAIEQNGLKPVVDSVFEFEDARSAFHAIEHASHVGKIVIKVGS